MPRRKLSASNAARSKEIALLQAQMRREAKEAVNRAERPDCVYPQHTALSAYNKGCRCLECVARRRAVARESQKKSYKADPAKFAQRQREYVERKRQRDQQTQEETP